MSGLIQNLIERAEAIRNGAEASRGEIERQIRETEAEHARLQAELRKIERIPTRHGLLLSSYESGERLCPQCSLERGAEIEMIATYGGSADFDVFKCPSCGLEEVGEP